VVTTASFKRAPEGAPVYQRWQFANLAAAQEAAPPPEPEVPMITANELALIKEAARKDGYGAGFAAGRADGRTAIEAETAHLHALCQALDSARVALQDDTAQALLVLAADIAHHVLRAEISLNPEAMLPAVREAIDLAGAGAHPQLLLNPGDVDFVRRHMGEDLAAGGWRLVEDGRIEPGGCKVATANGAVDATLTSRWRRIVATLGVDPLPADIPGSPGTAPAAALPEATAEEADAQP
jgi:flagellar assembly protein FliH